MLHNPSCSYITFLFLKNTETEEKFGKGSQMENSLSLCLVQRPQHGVWLLWCGSSDPSQSLCSCSPHAFCLVFWIFSSVNVRNSRALHRNKACLSAAALWQEMQVTLPPGLLELLWGTHAGWSQDTGMVASSSDLRTLRGLKFYQHGFTYRKQMELSVMVHTCASKKQE